MSSIAERINAAHRSHYDVLEEAGKNIDRFNRHWLKSFVAAYSGNGNMLEAYIRARLTNSATVRILLDQDYYEEEKRAIAEDIKQEVVRTLRTITKI